MKEIIALIRPERMNATKQALAAVGITSLTARRVSGRGKGLVDPVLLAGAVRGAEEAIVQLGPRPRFWPKRLLSIVVNDHNVRRTISTIIQVNNQGRPGDGKIFVSPVLEVYTVSSGVKETPETEPKEVAV